MANPAPSNQGVPSDDAQLLTPLVQAVANDPAADSAPTDTMTTDTEGPAQPATPTWDGRRRKEVLNTPLPGETAPAPTEQTPTTVEQSVAPEQPPTPEQSGDQPAEYESSQAEIEPTIEKLQAEIERNKVKAPDKVAVRQDKADEAVPKTVAQPVIILPISESKMAEAKKKDPSFSIRWLYTWARRQVRKLQNILVMYRDSPRNTGEVKQ